MTNKPPQKAQHISDLANNVAIIEIECKNLQDQLEKSEKTSSNRLLQLRKLENENKTLSSKNSEFEKEKKSSTKRVERERKGLVKNLEEQTNLVKTLKTELAHKANELECSKATAERLQDDLARLKAELLARSRQEIIKLVRHIYQEAVARTESQNFAQDINANPSTQSRPTTVHRRAPKSHQGHHHHASKATKATKSQGRFKNDVIPNAKGLIQSRLDLIAGKIRTLRRGENKHDPIAFSARSSNTAMSSDIDRRRRWPSEQLPTHGLPQVQYAAPSANLRQNTTMTPIEQIEASPGNVSLDKDVNYGSDPADNTRPNAVPTNRRDGQHDAYGHVSLELQVEDNTVPTASKINHLPQKISTLPTSPPPSGPLPDLPQSPVADQPLSTKYNELRHNSNSESSTDASETSRPSEILAQQVTIVLEDKSVTRRTGDERPESVLPGRQASLPVQSSHNSLRPQDQSGLMEQGASNPSNAGDFVNLRRSDASQTSSHSEAPSPSYRQTSENVKPCPVQSRRTTVDADGDRKRIYDDLDTKSEHRCSSMDLMPRPLRTAGLKAQNEGGEDDRVELEAVHKSTEEE